MFDPKQHYIKVQGNRKYLPVAARLVWFRQDHPDWTIETEALQIDTEKQFAIYRATIRNAEGRIVSQGTKMENVRGFGDWLEKAETGAIGRALAIAGFGTDSAPELDEGERYADSPQPARQERESYPSRPHSHASGAGQEQRGQGDRWNRDGNPNEDGWTAARKGFRDIAYTNGHILPSTAQRDACKRDEVALVLRLLGPDTKLQNNGWPFGGTYEEAARAIEEIARRGETAPPADDDFEDMGGPFDE